MRYTEPKVLTISNAVSSIQQVRQTGTTNKTADQYFDSHIPDPVACLSSAYEADE